jgi:hypothetical protein
MESTRNPGIPVMDGSLGIEKCDSIWNLQGIPKESVWNPQGICMTSVRNPYGFQKECIFLEY